MAGNDFSGSRAVPIPVRNTAAGYLAPVVGRTAVKDVQGYFGFPLIQKGEVITEAIYNRAHKMARLYELIASTRED